MEYQLIRSRRKTISISFDEEVQLVVKAPYFVPEYEIEAFLKKKEEWILATAVRLRRAKEQEAARRLRLENGDRLPFLGEEKVLSVVREDRSRGRVLAASDRILLFVPYEADYAFRRELLEKWYRREAARILSEKAERFAREMKVSFSEIHIKDQKSRWGSCSSRGNLNFNWRLLLSPEAVCDYVVIHELCHLVYMDHSKAFWQLVARYHPACDMARKWLRDNSEKLYCI